MKEYDLPGEKQPCKILSDEDEQEREVYSVLDEVRSRRLHGYKKYGGAGTHQVVDLLQGMIEELEDGINYSIFQILKLRKMQAFYKPIESADGWVQGLFSEPQLEPLPNETAQAFRDRLFRYVHARQQNKERK